MAVPAVLGSRRSLVRIQPRRPFLLVPLSARRGARIEAGRGSQFDRGQVGNAVACKAASKRVRFPPYRPYRCRSRLERSPPRLWSWSDLGAPRLFLALLAQWTERPASTRKVARSNRAESPNSSDGEGKRYFADIFGNRNSCRSVPPTRLPSSTEEHPNPESGGCQFDSDGGHQSWRIEPARVPASFAKRMVPKGMRIVFSALRHAGLAYWGACLASNQEVGVRFS